MTIVITPNIFITLRIRLMCCISNPYDGRNHNKDSYSSKFSVIITRQLNKSKLVLTYLGLKVWKSACVGACDIRCMNIYTDRVRMCSHKTESRKIRNVFVPFPGRVRKSCANSVCLTQFVFFNILLCINL